MSILQTRPTFLASALGAALWLMTGFSAFAADGDLDTNFDGDGIAMFQVSQNFDDQTEDLITLLDGSATDHDFAILKVTNFGSLDTSFGVGGETIVYFDLGGGKADHAMAIAQQSDGKLVVAGIAETAQSENFDFAVTRLHANGAIDTSFGTAGKVTHAIDLGGTNLDMLTDVAIQTDGKIVLAGWAERQNWDRDFAAVRLNADGSVDSTFGVQGEAIVHFDLGGLLRDEADAVALQADGKILLAGSSELNGGDYDFSVLRLLANGTLDPSYGLSGRQTVHFDRGGSNQDLAEAATLDTSGRLVIAGRSEGASHAQMDFAIARLLTNGLLDPSFSSNGKTTVGIDVGSGYDQASAVALAPAGQLIVAGRAHVTATNMDFAAIRLNDNGSVDTSFGTNGRSRVALDIAGNLRDEVTAMTVGIDGGIVMAGPCDTINGLLLTGVAKLEGASWFSWP